MSGGNVAFVGQRIDALVGEAEQPCSKCPELMSCRRCMQTTEIDNAVRQLVVCRVKPIYFKYRDPSAAVEQLGGEIPCLQVEGVAERRLRVRLRQNASPVQATDGRQWWLCGCDEEGRNKVLDILNR